MTRKRVPSMIVANANMRADFNANMRNPYCWLGLALCLPWVLLSAHLTGIHYNSILGGLGFAFTMWLSFAFVVASLTTLPSNWKAIPKMYLSLVIPLLWSVLIYLGR